MKAGSKIRIIIRETAAIIAPHAWEAI